MKLSLNKQAELYAQLSVMLASGLTLNQILQALARVEKSKPVKKILQTTLRNLQSGRSIRVSLQSGGLVTDPLFLQLIDIGEHTGQLGESFQQIASTMEEQTEFRSRLIQATTYPLVVLLVAVVVIFVMILFIVPSFADVYRSMGAELPWITAFVLNLNRWLTNPVFILLVTALVGFLLMTRRSASRVLLPYLTGLLYRLPVIGDTVLMIRNYEFCVSLALLTRSGIPLLKSLNLIVQHTADPIWRAQLKPLITGVESGRNLSDSMGSSSMVSPLIRQMILVGEETAELSDLMVKTAVIFKRHTDTRLKVLVALVEPALIVILGLTISLILISVYLPLFSAMGNFGN
ncbi:MAG: type II secretion system F family protein [Bacteroidetes bacterium]|nr:type II secretion system F family protein [Bacteroidota bacterium]